MNRFSSSESPAFLFLSAFQISTSEIIKVVIEFGAKFASKVLSSNTRIFSLSCVKLSPLRLSPLVRTSVTSVPVLEKEN